MLKRILLYSLLFVVVALGTAGVVIFLNKASSKGGGDISSENPEDLAFSRVVDATMNMENYYADFVLTSADGTVDILGSASVFDVGTSPSANVYASGKLLGRNVEITAKYNSDWLYLSYNNFKVKAKVSDLLEFANILGEIFSGSGETGINFDVDAILDDLDNMQIEEMETGYKFGLDISSVGHVDIWSGKDNLPSRIEASNITILGKEFTFVLIGKSGAAQKSATAGAEINAYLDISASKETILAALNTIQNMPIRVNGTVECFGQKIVVDFLIDKNANAYGSIKIKDIEVWLSHYNGTCYMNACGTKMKGDMGELLALFASYSDIDIDKLLGSVGLTQNSLSIAGVHLTFETRNNFLVGLTVEHEIASAKLKVSNADGLMVANPSKAYEKALLFSDVLNIVNAYYDLVRSGEYSATVSGNIKNISASANAYVLVGNGDVSAFVGANVNGIKTEVWNANKISYVSVLGTKMAFSNEFSAEMVKFLCEKLSITFSEFNFDVAKIVDIATDEIKSLTIEKDGHVLIVMKDATIECQKTTDGVCLSVAANILGENISVCLTLFNDAQKFKPNYDSLNANDFQNFDVFEPDIKALVNTLTKSHSAFSGSIRIYGPFGSLEWLDLGVAIDTYYIDKKIQLRIELTGLPTSELITDTSILNYNSQRVVLTYKNDTVYLYRYGVKSSGSEVLRFSKKYALSDLSSGLLSDIIGLGGLFGSSISNTISSANSMASKFDISNVGKYFELSKIDGQFDASIKVSKLAKQISDVHLFTTTKNDELNQFSAEFTAVLKIKINIKAV